MRLWHETLIPYLSTKRLSGQHRECCALRGKCWGRKHKTIDYIFKYSMIHLYEYHLKVINEMVRRGYNVEDKWYNMNYRGKSLGEACLITADDMLDYNGRCVYPEHDEAYLLECLDNLQRKNETMTIEVSDVYFNYRKLCSINAQHCYRIHLQHTNEHTIVIWTKEGGPYGN